MSTSPPPNRRLAVSAQDLAQARNLHHHAKYTECAALLLTAERGAEDATALLKAALDNIRRHPRQALGINEEATASDAKSSDVAPFVLSGCSLSASLRYFFLMASASSSTLTSRILAASSFVRPILSYAKDWGLSCSQLGRVVCAVSARTGGRACGRGLGASATKRVG